MKSLVVGNCERFRARARFTMERRGYEVIEARDGLAALQNAVEEAPALIWVDPALQGFDAIEIQERLAAEDATRAIPVLVGADCSA